MTLIRDKADTRKEFYPVAGKVLALGDHARRRSARPPRITRNGSGLYVSSASIGTPNAYDAQTARTKDRETRYRRISARTARSKAGVKHDATGTRVRPGIRRCVCVAALERFLAAMYALPLSLDGLAAIVADGPKAQPLDMVPIEVCPGGRLTAEARIALRPDLRPLRRFFNGHATCPLSATDAP